MYVCMCCVCIYFSNLHYRNEVYNLIRKKPYTNDKYDDYDDDGDNDGDNDDV